MKAKNANRSTRIPLILVSFHKWKITGAISGLIGVPTFCFLALIDFSSNLLALLGFTAMFAFIGLILGSIFDTTSTGNYSPSNESATTDPKMSYDKSSNDSGFGDFGGGGD